jgi:uncharacterized membrane protein
MAENQVILGLFADEAAADAAVESLKAWDKASDDIKFGAIGVLVLEEEGALPVTRKMGQRSSKKGAGIGLLLAVVAPPTLLAGVVGGGVLGSFHHKGLGLSDEDRRRIGAELVDGKAAVGVLVPTAEAGAVAGKLTELGGDVEAHPVSDEALEAAAAAAPEVEAPVPVA